MIGNKRSDTHLCNVCLAITSYRTHNCKRAHRDSAVRSLHLPLIIFHIYCGTIAETVYFHTTQQRFIAQPHTFFGAALLSCVAATFLISTQNKYTPRACVSFCGPPVRFKTKSNNSQGRHNEIHKPAPTFPSSCVHRPSGCGFFVACLRAHTLCDAKLESISFHGVNAAARHH